MYLRISIPIYNNVFSIYIYRVYVCVCLCVRARVCMLIEN